MNNYISIILVAMFGVLGNILYFNFQFRKQTKKEILKQRLTNLLLPLYMTLKNDDIEFEYTKRNDDPYDFESEKPNRLLGKLIDIIKDNLYLADNELHKVCVSFVEWAVLADTNERFQNLHEGKEIDEEEFKNFKSLVYERYNKERNKYLS